MSLEKRSKIDLLVIDSHILFRKGLKQLLERDSDLQVVGEGETGEQLLSLYEQYQPDAVLIDMNFDHIYEVEALTELIQRFPTSKVLLFTVNDDVSPISKAIHGGISGYLLKEMDSEMVIQAIKSVVSGEVYLHPKISIEFVVQYRKLASKEKQRTFLQKEIVRPYHLLTNREVQVLQLLADGHNNKSIGETLKITSQTANNHVTNILRKLDVHDRTRAVVIAVKNGWVELS